MDLSLVRRTEDLSCGPEEGDSHSQLFNKRPRLSFSVASLLSQSSKDAPSPSPPSPSSPQPPAEGEDGESEAESDVSVDSHGDENGDWGNRLNDSSERESGLGSPGGQSLTAPDPAVSPPRSEEPKLAMPTPLLAGGRLPIPGLPHPIPSLLPPGWPSLLPNPLNSFNSALFKSGM